MFFNRLHTYLLTKTNCILLVLACFKIGYSQQYNFKNYSAENGLPYVQIFAMYQDNQGYLWSGGYGGLSQFNGKVFNNYSPKNGLANHYVNAITQDKNGRIIVGTIEGLSIISKNRISNRNEKNGLLNKNINALCVNESNTVWIGTNKGLCKLINDSIYVENQFKIGKISCLLNTPLGLCIGTENGFYIKNKTTQLYITENGLCDNSVLSLAYNKTTNQIYIGTQNGLSVLNVATNKIVNFHVSNGLLDEAITAITIDAMNNVWIGSKNGLVSFNDKEFSYYTIGIDNNSNNISTLLVDAEENLWIGTHSGLYKYRGKGFTTFGRQEGLGAAFMYDITQDKNKNLWVTTENNGAYKYEKGFFKNYSIKNGLPSNTVFCVLPMIDGSVWFGTSQGVCVLQNNQIAQLKLKNTFLQDKNINCFLLDSKKNIWMGGKNGLCKMMKKNGETIIHYFVLPSAIKNYDVWTIKEDVNGTIWAGTYLAGLYKLENNAFVNQSSHFNFELESALDIDFDTEGILYAATLNGVLQFNPKTKQSKLITEKDGLSSELVYSLKLTNDKKYIWAGTNQGINKIDVVKLKQNYFDITIYNKADGFNGVECNSHGIYEDDHNNIWFGTVNGLIKYSPSQFITNQTPSQTNIASIKLGYEDTLLANGSVLSYDNNKITFYFDGICLTNPDKVLYSYKLEGFDKTWSPNTAINFAGYDNLPAGKYMFKVKSCNNEGIWNIEPVTFSFRIKSAFYKTWWFITISILLLSLIVYSIFKYRLMQIQKKQKADFDKKVEISKAELKALRAQMNPHFVFNSLNSIQHYILNNKGEEAVKYLSKFAKLIRNILNNSEKPTVTINEDLDSIKLYLELERMRFDNKFEYFFIIDDAIDADYDEIPPMIIQPYLENAILHGINPKEENGKIEVSINLVNNFIKISIKDDGIGREKSKASQTALHKQRHQSLGMKITEERVKILNSIQQSHLNVNIIDLYDKNNVAIGTQVDVFIPYIK